MHVTSLKIITQPRIFYYLPLLLSYAGISQCNPEKYLLTSISLGVRKNICLPCSKINSCRFLHPIGSFGPTRDMRQLLLNIYIPMKLALFHSFPLSVRSYSKYSKARTLLIPIVVHKFKLGLNVRYLPQIMTNVQFIRTSDAKQTHLNLFCYWSHN